MKKKKGWRKSEVVDKKQSAVLAPVRGLNVIRQLPWGVGAKSNVRARFFQMY